MPPPSIGSLVDDGTIELVSLIGQGGFASVYLARSTTCNKVYALKVLHNPPTPSTRDDSSNFNSDEERGPRPHHLREAKLHSLCTTRPRKNSSITPLLKTIFHPTTTTLHTCLLLPYYPSGDLFTAILTHKLFLANSSLIKSTFLQVLNGVDEAHTAGVFLRDIKPENCLLDGNGNVFLCDFGLATDEILSEEFRTGSVYHMSPECMGPRPYSPRQSDVWSLGILLLNLLTSRNPWKEASLNDPTYAAYFNSHPSVQAYTTTNTPPILPMLLPISERLSDILHMILHPNPSDRLTVEEIQRCIEELDEDNMDDWYDSKAVFDWEGGCARCPWEIENPEEEPEEEPEENLKSAWSAGSDSCNGSILAQRSMRFSSDSTPSPIFENTFSSSLTTGSAHIRGTPSSSSSDENTGSAPDFCGVQISTPKRRRRRSSWRVYEDEDDIDAPLNVSPSGSRGSPSSLSPIHRTLSVDSLSTSFLNTINIGLEPRSPPRPRNSQFSHSQPRNGTHIKTPTRSCGQPRGRSRPRPNQIFTAAASAVHVDSNGIPKTPKDVLASLGAHLNGGVQVRAHDGDIELEVTGVECDARAEGPVIEWVEHERHRESERKRGRGSGGGSGSGKGKGRKSFFGGITFGRMLFGGGGDRT